MNSRRHPICVAVFLSLAPTAFIATGAAPQDRETRAEDATGPARPADAPVNPMAAHSLDRLSATRDRPLFSPTRRPPPPPPPPPVAQAPEPPAPPPPPEVALLGIVMDGDEARAVVRAGSADKIVRARIGDEIGGWKVAQIEGRRLVLSLDGRVATFTMFSDDRAGRTTLSGSSAPSPDKQNPAASQSNQSRPRDIPQRQLRADESRALNSPPPDSKKRRRGRRQLQPD